MSNIMQGTSKAYKNFEIEPNMEKYCRVKDSKKLIRSRCL